MPPAILGIGAAVASFAVPTALGIAAGTLGFAVVGGLAAFGVSAIGAKIFGLGPPDMGGIVDDIERGTFVNTASTEAFVPVIYGQTKVGGLRFFGPEITGANDELMHMAIAWSEGEISGVQTLFIDDLESTDAVFSGLVDINHHVGTDTQAADADLVSRVAAWTTAHQAKGIAYTYAQITGDDSAFHSGLPELSAIIDGRLVLDPRDSLTKLSDNPALVIRDYATDTRYGRGIDASKLDDQSFIDAANFCDELVSVPDDAGGATTQKRYTANGVIGTERSTVDNMRDLLTSCRGRLIYTGGKWKLLIDKAESSVFPITEDHIIGEWSFDLEAQQDLLNRVKTEFLDPDKEWQPNFGIWDDPTVRTNDDNGLLLESTLRLPFTKNLHRAEQLALIAGKYTRFGLEVSMLCTIECSQLLPMDVVTVTHTTPGWTNKKFRVLDLEMLVDGNVRLFLREYDDSIYTLDPLGDAVSAPATNLPETRSINAPTNLNLDST